MYNGNAYSQFQSIQGPTDPMLRHSEIEGYQPVSRIGEVVINSFIDAYEFAQLPEALPAADLDGKGALAGDVEFKPHFHEWATVLPGMICLSRKARNATFRNYVAAETATPVIGCCACLSLEDAKNFYVRTPSVLTLATAALIGVSALCSLRASAAPRACDPSTTALARRRTSFSRSPSAAWSPCSTTRRRPCSRATCSSAPPLAIHEHSRGLLTRSVARGRWVFYNEANNKDSGRANKRLKGNPRRISVKVASPTSERVIGRCAAVPQRGHERVC